MSQNTTPKRSRWRRRRYVINRPFQLSFLARMNALALAVIAVVYGANTYFFWSLAESVAAKGIPRTHIFFRYIEHQQTAMDQVFAGASIAIVIMLSVFGILYSHRIAGPLYRLVADLKAMSEGGPTRTIKFRRGDYFPEVAEAFNQFIASRDLIPRDSRGSGEDQKSA